MTTYNSLKAALLAGVCMLPLSAVAQADDDFSVGTAAPAAKAPNAASGFQNEVSVGVGGVSTKSAVFGRYNGLTDSGVGAGASANVNSRDAWDSGNTHYFNFTADNVYVGNGHTAPEAAANVKVGEQGRWGVNALYDAMTYTATNNFTTILTTSGALVPGMSAALANNGAYMNNAATVTPFYALTAAKAVSGAVTTANVASAKTQTTGGPLGFGFPGPVLGSLNEVTDTIGTRRDKLGAGGNYQIGPWLITAALSNEHKEGTLEQTLTTAGSNTGMVAFPMPINYDTQNYNVGAAFNTRNLQAKLSYNLSNFVDHNSSGYAFQGYNFVAINNSQVAGSTPSFTSYAMSGNYALPPNNQAHTVTGEFGYNLTPTTRFNATAVYGLQMQNDAFVPATGNAYILGNPGYSANLGSNPSSLSGLVNTFFGNAAVTTRPLPNLNVKASYTIDVRDPQTSSQWIYGDPTDTAAANPNVTGAAGTSLKFRQAVPESWTKQTVALEAGYQVLHNTRLTVGYAYRDFDRENAITHHTADNEGSVKVNQTFSSNLMGSLGYVHADRTASAPDFSLWNTQINSDCGSNLTTATLGCQQVPFYEAARTEDAITAALIGTLHNDLSASLIGKFTNNDYHDQNALYVDNGVVTSNPSVGVNRDYNVSVGPTVNYRLSSDLEGHLFYSFVRTYRTMRALNAGAPATQTTPGVNEYSETSTYDIQTAGVGGVWKATNELKLGADYIYSYGDQRFNQSGAWDTNQGAGLPGDPTLKTNSGNNQFRIHATYEFTPSTQFYLGYRFDSLDMTDWALVGASAAQVLTGDVPAHYNVSTVMAAMKMKW